MVPNQVNVLLFEMIESVTHSPDFKSACSSLLLPILQLFKMDQASFCEVRNQKLTPIFSIDKTKRLLTENETIWISQTLMQSALLTMTPKFHTPEQLFEDGIPKSVSEHCLRSVVCIPIGLKSSRCIFLASQSDPTRSYSEEELNTFKIAAQAASLALSQHSQSQDLKETRSKLEKVLETQSHRMIYSDSKMDTLLEETKRLSPFNISILIQGESGVGKEELSKEIHLLSERKGRFIAINCANLSETLLESELFGYVKGAFTGAFQNKKGLLQEADQGTFFFDEIAELPFGLQAKLLRVFQERTVRPIGGTLDIPIDIRIISASHKNLKTAIEEKKFREDLYYRIQETTLEIPPLRDRPKDIEILASHFASQFALEFKMKRKDFDSKALEAIRSYSWPGNVRELKNVCRIAVILGKSDSLTLDCLKFSTPPKSAPILEFKAENEILKYDGPRDIRDLTRAYERNLITDLLKIPGQTQATVAQKLCISVRTIQRILDEPITEAQLAKGF